MGKEIVYCGGCWTGLREQDFAAGKAREVEGRPYCTACKPPQSAPTPGTSTPRRASGRVPRVPVPQTTRRATASGAASRVWLALAIAVGAFILLALILAAFPSGRPR